MGWAFYRMAVHLSFYHKPSFYASGFSLIELLISLSIIFMFMGLAYAGYARLIQRQTLANAGQLVKSIIRDTQNKAFTGEIDCNDCPCAATSETRESILQGWYVDFSDNSTYGVCSGSQFSKRDFVTDYKFSQDITVLSSQPQLIFQTYPPRSNISEESPLSVCLAYQNLTYLITVKSSGDLTDDFIDTCPIP